MGSTDKECKIYEPILIYGIGQQKKELFQLKIYPWCTVEELYSRVSKLMNLSKKDYILSYAFVCLESKYTLETYGILSDSTIDLLPRTVTDPKQPFIRLATEKAPNQFYCKAFLDALTEVQNSFLRGVKPEKLENYGSISGSYFLKGNNKKNLLIFKPLDEEPMAPNNPNNFADKIGSESLRRGILSGECGLRELAAYLLDHNVRNFNGYHRIPPTSLAEVQHIYFEKKNLQPAEKMKKKIGSLQLLVPHIGTSDNFLCSLFSDEEVHKIGILDIRILNCDRNYSNILIQEQYNSKNYTLIPIDHGLSLPDVIDICADEMVWMSWPQAKSKFSQKELEYINQIDLVSDIKILENLKVRKECLIKFKLAGLTLKAFAQNNKTLYDIGKFIYKEEHDNQVPTPFEDLILRTNFMFDAWIESETPKKKTIQFFIDVPESPNRKPTRCSSNIFKSNFAEENHQKSEILSKSDKKPCRKNLNLSKIINKNFQNGKQCISLKCKTEEEFRVYFCFFEKLLQSYILANEPTTAQLDKSVSGRQRIMSTHFQSNQFNHQSLLKQTSI